MSGPCMSLMPCASTPVLRFSSTGTQEDICHTWASDCQRVRTVAVTRRFGCYKDCGVDQPSIYVPRSLHIVVEHGRLLCSLHQHSVSM